jgi:hypothetical protein
MGWTVPCGSDSLFDTRITSTRPLCRALQARARVQWHRAPRVLGPEIPPSIRLGTRVLDLSSDLGEHGQEVVFLARSLLAEPARPNRPVFPITDLSDYTTTGCDGYSPQNAKGNNNAEQAAFLRHLLCTALTGWQCALCSSCGNAIPLCRRK